MLLEVNVLGTVLVPTIVTVIVSWIFGRDSIAPTWAFHVSFAVVGLPVLYRIAEIW